MNEYRQLARIPMGRARSVSAQRSRLRSYLLLARISNLPTVWTNVLAGAVASAAPLEAPVVVRLLLALSLFYTAGMFLNDAFDREIDRRTRPERPIPAGDVAPNEVFGVGYALLAGAALLLVPVPQAALLGLLLLAAIVYYDYRHKGSRTAPLVMGACRGLVYCIAAAGVGQLGPSAIIGAVILGSYVVGLTVVARSAGARARWLVPVLIAGISLVDAAFIAAVSGSATLVLLAVCAFGVTLFLQRFVPGD